VFAARSGRSVSGHTSAGAHPPLTRFSSPASAGSSEIDTIRCRRLIPWLLLSWIAAPAGAQVFSLSKEQMVQYTAHNPFERFPDGRPKVPDSLLEKLKQMSAEELLEGAGS
jgi:hypothetical protein